MHATFDAVLEQKGLVLGRRAVHCQNVAAIQLQCGRQCSEQHSLGREQLIVLVPHGPVEFLAWSFGHPAVVVSRHCRAVYTIMPVARVAWTSRTWADGSQGNR